PWPDPWPRPMRFFACFIPFGGRKLLSDIWTTFFCQKPRLRSAGPQALLRLFNLHEMSNLVDHSTYRRGVLQLHRVADAPQAETSDDVRLIALESDRAPEEPDLHRRAFRVGSLVRHDYAPALDISARSLPRSRAIAVGSFRVARPSNVARTTLCGFADPSDF